MNNYRVNKRNALLARSYIALIFSTALLTVTEAEEVGSCTVGNIEDDCISASQNDVRTFTHAPIVCRVVLVNWGHQLKKTAIQISVYTHCLLFVFLLHVIPSPRGAAVYSSSSALTVTAGNGLRMCSSYPLKPATLCVSRWTATWLKV